MNATVSDSRGKQAVATAAVTVQFNNPPVISVTSPINGASFIEGETIAFTAAATDIEDGDMSSNIEWYAQGVLIGTGSSFSPNLAVGVHDVQAKVTDNNGKSALVEFQVAVIFNNPPQLSVESPSQDIVTEQYLLIYLAATANDVESGDLSANITWGSDISGPLGTGDQLDVTLSVGVHTLTVQVIDPLTNKISTVSRSVTVNAPSQFTYCSAGGERSRRSWIEHVDISDTSNTSGNQGGYGDFTGLGPIYLQSGRAHDITLTPGFSSRVFGVKWHVWIDLNRDGQFGSDERVMRAKGSRNVSSRFEVPVGSVAGLTRMRIVMRKDRQKGVCDTFSVGEVEDYSVVLLP
ncbi:MAG: GEVED domain-containing protein [Candidatus Thiodiazotropha sp.]